MKNSKRIKKKEGLEKIPYIKTEEVEKLKDAGFNSITELAISSWQEIAERANIPEKRAKVIRERARRLEGVDSYNSGNAWVLKDDCKDCKGVWAVLIEIKTGTDEDKTESIKKIRNEVNHFGDKYYDKFRTADLDFAIFLEVTPMRYLTQDLDNVQKVVFDALKEDTNDPSWKNKHLYKDDKKISRVIAWKVKREEDAGFNTDSLTISFRIHDPSKQMIMEKENKDFIITEVSGDISDSFNADIS